MIYTLLQILGAIDEEEPDDDREQSNRVISTSYFAMVKRLPSNAFPISIAAKTPDWYQGVCYNRLAPSFDILAEYKQIGDEKRYIRRYSQEILGKLRLSEVLDDLQLLTPAHHSTVLLCYERPEKFCHRHLVADWFTQNGIPVSELTF